MHTPLHPTHLRRSRSDRAAFGVALSAFCAALVCATSAWQSLPAAAQSQSPGQRSEKPQQSQPAEPAPKGLPDKPAPDAGNGQPKKPVLPQARSDGARALDKLPQTAEEKSRSLNDLYAKLATAENEDEAKKLAGQIERLWRHSGSDTANLLVSRALKVAGEKRNELALRLFDHAIELAPDYTEAFTQRAFFHFTQSNMHAAVGDLRRVLALDPNHFKAMEGLAQIWRDSGNKKGAYEVTKQLLDVHPFAAGAKQNFDELKRAVEGQGI